jgi:hypothetical protein
MKKEKITSVRYALSKDLDTTHIVTVIYEVGNMNYYFIHNESAKVLMLNIFDSVMGGYEIDISSIIKEKHLR